MRKLKKGLDEKMYDRGYNDAVEECARAADKCEWELYGYKGRISLAIRALKDKP